MREYQPFAYPPDYALARIHQQASMPGKIDHSTQNTCPCCSVPLHQPFPSWFGRSIDHDFKNFGGAVVSYFWLVKLYGFICALIVAIYSGYLIICIHQFCSAEKGCVRFLGLWIISNENLYNIMRQEGHMDIIIRLFTLRGMAYIIMLIGNAVSLYIVGRFKRRYPQPKRISDFALIFKNVKVSVEQFTLKMKEQFPDASIKQIFAIKKMEPFYTLYRQKLSTYYQTLIEEEQKKKIRNIKMLDALDRKCGREEANFDMNGDRIILLLNSEIDRKIIMNKYCLNGTQKSLHLLGIKKYRNLYCDACPIPEQIIWNNIGQEENQKVKVKILSVLYFFLILAGSYVFLYFCMKVVYRSIFPDPWNYILAQFILTFLVVIALTFRQWMNKLSEMRHPNTQTSRTMFIVLTTVLFHFIYYLIIPTFYFTFAKNEEKNQTLQVITNQTFNFLVVQFLLAGFDLMHCCWNKRLKKIENEDKPIGCQKILHEQIQYPRFPIQFKLIILFKTFSFIIFFAFQVPSIMVLMVFLMLFLYFKDKHSVYYHYRMEIIDNGVQFQFLKVYSNFFSVYMFLIFSLTQYMQVQFWIGFSLMVIAIIIQTFLIKQRVHIDDITLPATLEELEITDSYRKRYLKFREGVIHDRTDLQIKQYLATNGYGSIQTEQSMNKALV